MITDNSRLHMQSLNVDGILNLNFFVYTNAYHGFSYTDVFSIYVGNDWLGRGPGAAAFVPVGSRIGIQYFRTLAEAKRRLADEYIIFAEK